MIFLKMYEVKISKKLVNIMNIRKSSFSFINL